MACFNSSLHFRSRLRSGGRHVARGVVVVQPLSHAIYHLAFRRLQSEPACVFPRESICGRVLLSGHVLYCEVVFFELQPEFGEAARWIRHTEEPF